MTYYILWLPKLFWADHYDRCADHDGMREEIREAGNRVLVKLDSEALANLKSDADYYADPIGFESYLRPLIRSAQATVRVIGKLNWTSPWGGRAIG